VGYRFVRRSVDRVPYRVQPVTLNVFKNGDVLFCEKNISLSAPNFEKTLLVVIKQGGIAKAAIDGVINIIDSIINFTLFLVTK
jgi:hypothetical protein